MKYYNAIITLFSLSIISVVLLLYFASITRAIEKQNFTLNNELKQIKYQININEIEHSIYSSYDYVNKLKKIYFSQSDNSIVSNRITLNSLKDKNIKNLHTVGIK